ncbi:hypothetical protein CRUP_030517 [Coryphaenoides rupestris]|nr:hypothetical protein CRUP_030517 [Coryphaenoides rupestris]
MAALKWEASGAGEEEEEEEEATRRRPHRPFCRVVHETPVRYVKRHPHRQCSKFKDPGLSHLLHVCASRTTQKIVEPKVRPGRDCPRAPGLLTPETRRCQDREPPIKTKGVDEHTIIDILTKRSYAQRREIAFAYERRAKKGLGTDEETLIEILCSRSNQELVEIKRVYKELFKKDLEKDVAGDTSGNFAKLLLALVEGKRAEAGNVVDYQKIDDDARALYEAGVKRKGTDVSCWISILSERSVQHLQKVFQKYKSYSPYDMQESIRKEVKGDLEKSFLTLVDCVENKQLYFASRLNDAMKSKGAKEKVVTRIMVSRCEVDLGKIRTEFKSQYGQSLHQTIAEHTKDDYQRALLSLCGGDD